MGLGALAPPTKSATAIEGATDPSISSEGFFFMGVLTEGESLGSRVNVNFS